MRNPLCRNHCARNEGCSHSSTGAQRFLSCGRVVCMLSRVELANQPEAGSTEQGARSTEQGAGSRGKGARAGLSVWLGYGAGCRPNPQSSPPSIEGRLTAGGTATRVVRVAVCSFLGGNPKRRQRARANPSAHLGRRFMAESLAEVFPWLAVSRPGGPQLRRRASSCLRPVPGRFILGSSRALEEKGARWDGSLRR